MSNLALYDLQQEILHYFQGEKVDSKILPEESIAELGIYKSLVISAMEDYIEKVFNSSYEILKPRFRDIIKDYLEKHPSSSPLFFMLAKDFPAFINSDFFIQKYQPANFLYELTLYEWTEVVIQNSKNLEPRTRLNPIHKILDLNFPISKLKQLIAESDESELEELRISDLDKEREIVMIFRDPSCKTRFFALTDASLDIINNIDLGLTAEEIYLALIKKYSLIDNETTKNSFDNLLNELKKNHILLE